MSIMHVLHSLTLASTSSQRPLRRISDPGCELEIHRCLMGYSPEQNSDAWYDQRTCVEKTDMPCQKKSETLWWINDELRKLMEMDRIYEGRNDKDNEESSDKDDDKWEDKD